MDNGHIERTFTLSPGATPRIRARTPTGTIHVVGEERADVVVAINVKPGDLVGRDIEVTVEQNGEEVLAEVKHRHDVGFGWLRGNSRSITIEIRAPRRSDVDADSASGTVTLERLEGAIRSRTASGDVRVTDLARDITLQTASGDIGAHALSGAIKINSASGDVTLERGQGELDVHTASGDVHLDQIIGTLALGTASGDCTVRSSALRMCRAKTASGDLAISTPLAREGDYDFQTVSGDLTLNVPEETAATVSIKTISGSLSSSLPATSDGGKRNRTLVVNGGGVPVNVKTVSGDCTIRAARDPLPTMPAAPARPMVPPAPAAPPAPPSWPASPAPPAPPAPPVQEALPAAGSIAAPEAPQEDGFSQTLAIMQAVERGELSIDEAMTRLAALESDTGRDSDT